MTERRVPVGKNVWRKHENMILILQKSAILWQLSLVGPLDPLLRNAQAAKVDQKSWHLLVTHSEAYHCTCGKPGNRAG